MKERIGVNQQKILTLLLGGVALSFSRSPKQYFRILKDMRREWKKINERALRDAIKRLYESRLVAMKENKDGMLTVILTEEGKLKALTYDLDSMKIKKPGRWDRKWRMILFDIPEKKKKIRDIFRHRLKKLGFYEFQKSVFVFPYDCGEEMEYLVEFYNVRKFVRVVLAESMDNELHLKKYFEL
jgi:DNA-binding transcriptional regulator PaaX